MEENGRVSWVSFLYSKEKGNVDIWEIILVFVSKIDCSIKTMNGETWCEVMDLELSSVWL